ncbi:positive regulator of sigma E, RseC/MucC [Desulfosarcina variabilis str. Montpellier]|uniref:SoxR reducing system RseC family protein n=1 Tax=Desulfosarcina variabilis TaxID=2300 RepID=UPI003AFA969B
MAIEEGVVFKMGTAGKAWVRTTRSSACESCSSRDTCQGEGAGQEMEVEAINTAQARVGDRIVLNIKTASLLKATFLLYVFPILAMLAGAIIGQRIAEGRGSDPSAMAALFAFGFFGLAFVVIRITGRRLAKDNSYRPEIIKVRNHPPQPSEDLMAHQAEP